MSKTTTTLSKIREKYDLGDIINNRYGKSFFNFYVNSEKKILELDNLGLYVWELFGILWQDEKQELILNILTCLNTLEKISLELKKKLYDLIKEEDKMELFEKDRVIWDLLLSEYYSNHEWVDLDLEWDQLKEKNKLVLDKLYFDVVNWIESNGKL
jgi:hypothetical protein